MKNFFKFHFYYFIANWLSERRFFWDFVRPACIGSARPSSKSIKIDKI